MFMKKQLLLLMLAIFLGFPLFSQKVEVLKYDDLKEIINDSSADIQIINFWATWCKPCIKEIPYFEGVNSSYKNRNVKVVLVSLDFVEDLESKVVPFVRKRNLKAEIKLLDETDFDAIINDVNSSWSGAIPATLVINNKTGETEFYEKEFKEGELEEIIETQLKGW